MNTADRGLQLLATTRDSLKALLSEALSKGEYEAIQKLALWAKQVDEFLGPEKPVGGAVSGGQFVLSRSLPGMRAAGRKQPRLRRSRRKKRIRKRALTALAEGAVFRRDGDILVKIGASRSDSGEYQHRVPKWALDLLVGRMAAVRDPGQLIRMDDLLPLADEQANRDVPVYQAYVGIAWLRSESLVRQHGRQGYTVGNAARLTADVNTAFDNLVPM